MGTRSTTEVRSKWNEEWRSDGIVYRHWDGYPSCHGIWLAEFLDGLHVVNGILADNDMPERYANGPGRLLAQIVHKLQEDGHDPSIMSQLVDCWQEFHYRIDVQMCLPVVDVHTSYPVSVSVFSDHECQKQLFCGTVKEFKDWCRHYE